MHVNNDSHKDLMITGAIGPNVVFQPISRTEFVFAEIKLILFYSALQLKWFQSSLVTFVYQSRRE